MNMDSFDDLQIDEPPFCDFVDQDLFDEDYDDAEFYRNLHSSYDF